MSCVQVCLGQVAVCVLLSIHALQILLLYQDVDAFLTETEEEAQGIILLEQVQRGCVLHESCIQVSILVLSNENNI